MANQFTDSFWSSSEYYRQPPLTGPMIEHAERNLGVKLPDVYVELLTIQNGGYLNERHNAFPTHHKNSWAPNHVPFEFMFGIPAPSADPAGSVLDTAYLIQEWGLPKDLVLLSGDGHYWVALDYRNITSKTEPRIQWIDEETGDDFQLANTLSDFIHDLRPMNSF